MRFSGFFSVTLGIQCCVVLRSIALTRVSIAMIEPRSETLTLTVMSLEHAKLLFTTTFASAAGPVDRRRTMFLLAALAEMR